jgi:hypothetical protein
MFSFLFKSLPHRRRSQKHRTRPEFKSKTSKICCETATEAIVWSRGFQFIHDIKGTRLLHLFKWNNYGVHIELTILLTSDPPRLRTIANADT